MSSDDIGKPFWALVSKYPGLGISLDGYAPGENLALFTAWARDEGNGGLDAHGNPVPRPDWNPLDSTLVLPGSTPFNFNGGQPVQNYKDRAQGVEATAKTLMDPRHARILNSLRVGNSSYYTAVEIGYDGSWGSDPGVIEAVLHDMGIGRHK
jgi:hypothetical protein